MRNFKRIQAWFLAVILAVCCFATTAFAAEASEPVTNTVDFVITSDMESEGIIAVPVPAALVDQTFTMGTSHRGADRSFSGSTLEYAVSITNADGNPVSDVIQLTLHNYNQSTPVHSNEITANGNYRYHALSIVSGRVYYFKYTKLSGSTSTLRVHMQINSY